MTNHILIFVVAIRKPTVKFHMQNSYISSLSESHFLLCILLTLEINFRLLLQVSLEKRQEIRYVSISLSPCAFQNLRIVVFPFFFSLHFVGLSS